MLENRGFLGTGFVCNVKHHDSERKSNKMQQCIKILFHIYIKPTRFARHTTQHQEPKIALAASGSAYM